MERETKEKNDNHHDTEPKHFHYNVLNPISQLTWHRRHI